MASSESTESPPSRKSAHTALPWRSDPPADESDPGGLVVEGANGEFIADLWGSNQVGDARLIVHRVNTWQDMYEALKAVVVAHERDYSLLYSDALDQVNKAIAKAESREG